MPRKVRQPLTVAPPPAAAASAASSDDDHQSHATTDSSSEDESPQPKQPDPPTKPHLSDSDSDSDHPKSPTVVGKRKNKDVSDMGSKKKKPKSNSKPASLPTPHVTAVTDVAVKSPTKKKSNNDEHVPSGSFEPLRFVTALPALTNKSVMTKEPKRVWSKDDEIVVLKGLIEFKEKFGKDPMLNVDAFVDFVKSSFHLLDAKRDQIVAKIRGLKTRFQNPKKRTLTDPHEVSVFNLSKSIWGGSDDGVGGDVSANEMSLKGCGSKSKSKRKSNVDVDVDVGEKVNDGDVGMTMGLSHGVQLGDLSNFVDVDEKFMDLGLKLLGEDERAELEEECRTINVVQMEGLVKGLELYRKTAKTILNAVKSAKC